MKLLENYIELLPYIEHLDYVIGCVAISATGDGKYELDKLIKSIEENNSIATRIATELQKLKDARERFSARNYEVATGHLVSANASLWTRVIDYHG